VVTPLGYEAGLSAELPVTVIGGDTVAAEFALDCIGATGSPRSMGFWKHQVGVATGGPGQAHIDAATVCEYLDVIDAHFNSNAINEVGIYVAPSSGTCEGKLDVAKELLNFRGNVGMRARARQHLMALLFNVAAQYVSLTEIVSNDGATMSQAVTFCDHLIDETAGDHETARSVAATINGGLMVAAGVIPLDTDDIAYTRPRLAELTLRVSPNPGGSHGYTMSFGMPIAGLAELVVYNVAGRRIATLVSGDVEAGRRQVIWAGRASDGRQLSHGVYFARLTTPAGSRTAKFVHLAQ
jgi:hypothetical protein